MLRPSEWCLNLNERFSSFSKIPSTAPPSTLAEDYNERYYRYRNNTESFSFANRIKREFPIDVMQTPPSSPNKLLPALPLNPTRDPLPSQFKQSLTATATTVVDEEDDELIEFECPSFYSKLCRPRPRRFSLPSPQNLQSSDASSIFDLNDDEFVNANYNHHTWLTTSFDEVVGAAVELVEEVSIPRTASVPDVATGAGAGSTTPSVVKCNNFKVSKNKNVSNYTANGLKERLEKIFDWRS